LAFHPFGFSFLRKLTLKKQKAVFPSAAGKKQKKTFFFHKHFIDAQSIKLYWENLYCEPQKNNSSPLPSLLSCQNWVEIKFKKNSEKRRILKSFMRILMNCIKVHNPSRTPKKTPKKKKEEKRASQKHLSVLLTFGDTNK
jgi:hypothetical protein